MTRQIIKKPSLLIVAALTLAVFASAVLFTDPSYAAGTCDGTKTTVIKCSDDRNGIWSLLLIVLNILTAGVGIVAVAGIVYASILWTTSEDKAESVNKAKSILSNTNHAKNRIQAKVKTALDRIV